LSFAPASIALRIVLALLLRICLLAPRPQRGYLVGHNPALAFIKMSPMKIQDIPVAVTIAMQATSELAVRHGILQSVRNVADTLHVRKFRTSEVR
jgi:hypothetical protein